MERVKASFGESQVKERNERILQILTSNLMEGVLPSEFYHIPFWEKINSGKSETAEHLLFRYQYLDYKLEILFDKKTEAIKYIMLEIFPGVDDRNNKEISIIDDTHIFESRNELTTINKDVNDGIVELYYDEDDKYLTSLYYIPEAGKGG